MKCSIKLKSFNNMVLEKISDICLKEAKNLNISKVSVIRLPKKVRKFSLIKSPHVHKKSREQFEIINYTRLLKIDGSKEVLEKIIENNIINNKHTFYYKIQWNS
jgi:small subunit ribosomal protein S10